MDTEPAPTPKAALSGSAFPPHLCLHPVVFLPNPAFPNLLVPWNYIIFLLGSVPVLLGRGIVTVSGKTPRLASVEAAVASA